MAKIAEAFVEISARTSKLRRGLQQATRSVRDTIGRMAAVVRKLTVALGGLGVIAGGFVVKAFGKQQKAEEALRATLRASGDEVENNLRWLKLYASEIQKLTTYGDEFTLSLFSQLRAMGVLVEQLPEAAKAAIGLAKAFELDTKAAVRYIALGLQGEFTALQRIIPAMRSATTEQEKFNLIIKAAEVGFAQAQSEINTFPGALDQLKMALGDAAEGFGRILVGGEDATDSLRTLATNIGRFASFVNDIAGSVRQAFAGAFDYIFTLAELRIAELKMVFLQFKRFATQTFVDLLGDLQPFIDKLLGRLPQTPEVMALRLGLGTAKIGRDLGIAAPGSRALDAQINALAERLRLIGIDLKNAGVDIGLAFIDIADRIKRGGDELDRKAEELSFTPRLKPTNLAAANQATVQTIQSALGGFRVGQDPIVKAQEKTTETIIDQVNRMLQNMPPAIARYLRGEFGFFE